MDLNLQSEQSLNFSVGQEESINLQLNSPDQGPNIDFEVEDEETLSFKMDLEDELSLNLSMGEGGGTKDYNELHNKPQINNVTLQDNLTLDDIGLGTYLLETNHRKIFIDTKAGWAANVIVSEKGAIYIFSDQYEDNGRPIPGVKIGDGNAYVIDLPFIGKIYDEHMLDTVIHITESERQFWNNKVRCYMEDSGEEKLIFTTN